MYKFKLKKILAKHKKVAEYLKAYTKKKLCEFKASPKQNLNTNKIIWQFWSQGIDENTPTIVKACFASVDKYKGEYKVIRLSKANIKDYIDLPHFIYEKLENNKSFKLAFFSDILRLYLLSAYGGIWIDATIYLTNKIPANLLEKDFFMYQRDINEQDRNECIKLNKKYFSWHKDFKVKVLNSFIIAKANNPTIERLRQILVNYWKEENEFIDYFLFQIIFDEIINSYNNCEIISDALPHLMTLNEDEKYSQELWDKITNRTCIHKLTYYKKIKKNSIIEHILDKHSIDVLPRNIPENLSFCTLCFNMKSNNLNKIKKENRRFESFYLESLKKLIERYQKISIWCDKETADFIAKHKLNVNMRIMDFNDLPLYKNRGIYLEYLREMKEKSFNEGYLFQKLQAEELVDYIILVLSKIDVLRWSKENDIYNSEYFHWIDAGTFNDAYLRCWRNWDGIFDIKTRKFKSVFMTKFDRIYTWLFTVPSYEDIALIKAPFEIAGGHWCLPKSLVDEFCENFNDTLLFLNKKRLVSSEQSVFSTMLKMGKQELFDFSLSKNYIETVNLVSKEKPNEAFAIKEKAPFFKYVLLRISNFLKCKYLENKIKQKIIYKPFLSKILKK